jgi:hypothetical protein
VPDERSYDRIASAHQRHKYSPVAKFVMAGLVPAIHAFSCSKQDVDARVKPAHDCGGLWINPA